MVKTKLGLDQNIEGALCYLLAWITGIVFYILEDENEFVKFHAMQSIIVFLPLTILSMILGGFFGFVYFSLGFLYWISWLLWVITIILWLILMLKAFTGDKFKVPIAGDIAENMIKKK
ncbi:hypothetical protein AYK20_01510 [Thermoplasmatales archaeon SG8-52-1]|nr:MAG: hypothetical protein AYK20_01510 [Thermoplasmatales archaeon SG8-52-1]